MTQSSPIEVVRADPRLRRNAWLGFFAMTVAGVFVIGWGWPAMRDWLLAAKASGRVPGRWICLGFLGLVTILALGVTGMGVNFISLARRAIAHQQLPPPGVKVIRDTRVLRGPRAVAIARVQGILGLLLIVCSLALLALSAYVTIRLLARA